MKNDKINANVVKKFFIFTFIIDYYKEVILIFKTLTFLFVKK